MSTTTNPATDAAERRYEVWKHWPVNWTAVWTGVLTALAVALIIGLIAVAVGANELSPTSRLLIREGSLAGNLQLWPLIFSIAGAFFAFLAGGWVAGKIAGILHAEPAMLHGAVVWLLTVPFLLAFAALGAGQYFGAWYGGLAGNPIWGGGSHTPYQRPELLIANPTESEREAYARELAEYREHVHAWNQETPHAIRSSALTALTALLVGLVGSVIGGWLACGEPMTFTYYRKRHQLTQPPFSQPGPVDQQVAATR
jgi:hypothetical protein